MEFNNKKINYKTCFLGPKGENNKYILDLMKSSVSSSMNAREEKNLEVSSYFEKDYFQSDEHINTVSLIKDHTEKVCEYLKGSVQFSSLKYQAHMWGDQLIPSYIGYFASLLYNQNSLQHAMSNKTFFLEQVACDDILKMIGFKSSLKSIEGYNFVPMTRENEIEYTKKESETIYGFSHLNGGGTISNIEAIWASYFVKCLPVAIKNAISNNEDFKYHCSDIKVSLFNGKERLLTSLSNWELLNLNSDIIVNLPYIISLKTNLPFNKTMEIIKRYHVSTLGVFKFLNANKINEPLIIATSTAHYSIAKSASLFGLGINNIKFIQGDENGRMKIGDIIDTIDECIKNEIPVINMVALLGSTQESSVDNIDEILKIRNQYRLNNFNFDLQVDGAYGGYFASMVNKSHEPMKNPPDQDIFDPKLEIGNTFYKPNDSFHPKEICSDYLWTQLNSIKLVDSVTVDPHKTGFTYSCGAVCYRNSKYKDILANTTVYIGGNVSSSGISGIQGSRDGTSVTALFLSHSIVRPSYDGYGYLLKKTILSSKLFYIKLLHLAEKNQNNFNVNAACKSISNDKYQYLKSKLLKKDGKLIDIGEIEQNYHILNELALVGGDLGILCFCFNFIDKNTNQLNQDYDQFVSLNERMIKDIGPYQDPKEIELILSSTVFFKSHGNTFLGNILKSTGLQYDLNNDHIRIPCTRVTIMDPFLCDTNGENGSFINNMIDTIEKKLLRILKEFSATRLE